ncbi:MAG: glycerol-3-phosphate acyltransferase, partial [Pararhizobium sp.]
LAAATLILDALKGTVAVLVAASFGFDLAIVAGLGAFLGHLFPVWLGFRGGKGVATYIGVLIGLVPIMVVVFAVVWIGVALVTRFSSLAALIAMVATTLVIYFAGHGNVAGLFAIMTVISYIKHRKNIARLIAGTESRIGAKG